jgi:hypothetical protein
VAAATVTVTATVACTAVSHSDLAVAPARCPEDFHSNSNKEKISNNNQHIWRQKSSLLHNRPLYFINLLLSLFTRNCSFSCSLSKRSLYFVFPHK